MNTAFLEEQLRKKDQRWFELGSIGVSVGAVTDVKEHDRVLKHASLLPQEPVPPPRRTPRIDTNTGKKTREMERPGRIIEQLQNVQTRQRRVIQQLQAENSRRLADLADVRQERDVFRREVARVRKENAELQNRLEEVMTEYQDLRRERAMLARSVVTANHTQGRGTNLGLKILNTLSVLNEEQVESPFPTQTTTATENVASPDLETYLHRDLPDPPKSGDSPRPDNPASNTVIPVNDSKNIPIIRTTSCRGHTHSLSATL